MHPHTHPDLHTLTNTVTHTDKHTDPGSKDNAHLDSLQVLLFHTGVQDNEVDGGMAGGSLSIHTIVSLRLNTQNTQPSTVKSLVTHPLRGINLPPKPLHSCFS